jgi:hypothetical protein
MAAEVLIGFSDLPYGPKQLRLIAAKCALRGSDSMSPSAETARGLEYCRWEVSSGEPLAERASRKLKNDESLVVNFAASCLRTEMDRVPLWEGIT